MSFLPEAQVDPEEYIHSKNSKSTLKSLSILCSGGEDRGGNKTTKCKLQKKEQTKIQTKTQNHKTLPK